MARSNVDVSGRKLAPDFIEPDIAEDGEQLQAAIEPPAPESKTKGAKS